MASQQNNGVGSSSTHEGDNSLPEGLTVTSSAAAHPGSEYDAPGGIDYLANPSDVPEDLSPAGLKKSLGNIRGLIDSLASCCVESMDTAEHVKHLGSLMIDVHQNIMQMEARQYALERRQVAVRQRQVAIEERQAAMEEELRAQNDFQHAMSQVLSEVKIAQDSAKN